MLTNRELKRCLCVRRKVSRKAFWRLLKKYEKVFQQMTFEPLRCLPFQCLFSQLKRGVKGKIAQTSDIHTSFTPLSYPYLAEKKTLEWQTSQQLKCYLLSNTFSYFFKSCQDIFLYTFLLIQRHLFNSLFVSIIVYHYLIYKL